MSAPTSLRVPYKGAPLPTELEHVVQAWSALPEHIRAAILALVGTVRPGGGR